MECLKDVNGYLINANNDIQAFNVEIDNSTGSASRYSIFDLNSFCSIIIGQLSNKVATGGSINPQLLSLSTATNPIYISGFNYQVNNPAQFSESFDYVKTEIDSTFRIIPLVTSELLRNTQFDNTLLTIETKLYFDLKSCIVLSVLPATIINITFFVEKVVNLP